MFKRVAELKMSYGKKLIIDRLSQGSMVVSRVSCTAFPCPYVYVHPDRWDCMLGSCRGSLFESKTLGLVTLFWYSYILRRGPASLPLMNNNNAKSTKSEGGEDGVEDQLNGM